VSNRAALEGARLPSVLFYLEALARAGEQRPDARAALAAETFTAMQIPRGNETAKALRAMAARVGSGEPKLAALTRELQDVTRRRTTIRAALAEEVTRPVEQREVREDDLKRQLREAEDKAEALETQLSKIERQSNFHHPTKTNYQPPAEGEDSAMPYLEGALWTTLHHSLGTEIIRQLAPKLRPRYVALPVERFVMDMVSGVSVTSASIYPDVGVTEALSHSPGHAGATTVSAPLRLATLMPEAVPHVTIEIRDTRQRELVTAMEILSPTNKRWGGAAASAPVRPPPRVGSGNACLRSHPGALPPGRDASTPPPGA
jgi:hypothetical protein